MNDMINRSAMAFDLAAVGALHDKTSFHGVGMETHYVARAFDKNGKFLWEECAKNRVVTVGLNKLLDATFKTGLASPLWYIGICGPSVSDGVTTASSATLTSATAGFAAGDATRNILVRGAGVAGADIATTIATFNSSTSIALGVTATTALTNVPIIFEARAADIMSSHSPWSESAAYSSPSTRPAFTPGSIAAGSVDNSGSPASYTINANNVLIGGLFLVDNNTISGTTGTLYGMAPFTISFRQLNSGDTLTVTATLTAAST